MLRPVRGAFSPASPVCGVAREVKECIVAFSRPGAPAWRTAAA